MANLHESSSPLGRRQEGRLSEHGVCLGSIPGCMQPPPASQSLPIVSRSVPKSSIELQKAAKYFTFLQKISIDFPESRLINGLKGERAEKINDAGVDRRSAPAPACWSFLPSSFRFLLSKRRAGAIFTIADGVFVGRVGALSVRPGGRGASLRAKRNAASAEHPRAMSLGTADPAEKTGRSIRRPARIRPLHKKPEPVSSPSQADGRQPFMP